MHKKIFVILVLILLYSCSSKTLKVDHHIPATLGLSPESSGRTFGGSVELTGHVDHKLNLVSSSQSSLFGNVSDVTIDTDKTLKESFGIGAKLSLGAMSFIDFLIKESTESPTMWGAKIQLIGGSVKEQKEGFKLAVAGYYGQGTDTEQGSYTFSYNDGGSSDSFDDVSGETLIKQREIAVIFGYRLKKWLLVYGNAFYTHVASKATLTVNNRPVHVLADSEYATASVGARFNSYMKHVNFFGQVEMARSRAKILRESSKNTITAIDITGGMTW